MKNKKRETAVKWLFRYSKKYIWAILLLSLFGGCISGSFILLALISKRILDIPMGNAEGNLLAWSGAAIGVVLLQAVLNILISNLLVMTKGKIEISIKQKVVDLLMKKDWQCVTSFHSGELLNRLTSDVDIAVSGIVTIIPEAISLLTKLIAGLCVLLYIDRKFTLLIMAAGAVVFIFSRLLSGRYKALHKLCQQTDGATRGFIQECIENIVVIKSYCNNLNIIKRLDDFQQNNYKMLLKRNFMSNTANTGVYILFTASYYAALIWGAIQIGAGSITYGTLAAFLQVIEEVKAPMRNMSGLLPKYFSMTASAERIMELENLKEEEIINTDIDLKRLYSDMQSINVEDITFKYKNEYILRNADTEIKKGEIIAISGGSGTGKSTLMKLLLGLIKAESGNIFIKTQDKNIPLDSGTRGLFAYVPQGNMILSGTIKENICFCNPSATDEEIKRAITTADISSFIETLDEGIETVIGERGIGLSEGQIQRIAIARAILCDAPILLLDEATSALDASTESNVLSGLRKLSDKTCIFITHKKTTMEKCDRIINIKDHKIFNI
ncbi:MAG: ABC transporter ATP-binding protein [Firmicutes bacterium]|nr:ABC transporter ATP-binding protein [Bacillota bacterium]